MGCNICGQEGLLDGSGVCAECGEKLKMFSQTSSSFRIAASEGLEAGLKPTVERNEGPVSPTPLASAARLLSSFGQGPDCKLCNPFSVALSSNHGGCRFLLVLDQPERNAYRVTRFDFQCQFVRQVLLCRKGENPDEMKYPKGIAIDTGGNIYIPDAGNHRIQRFDENGKHLGCLGTFGDGPGEFNFPCDVETDAAGAVYVADTQNNRIQKLTAHGVPLLQIGVDEGPAGLNAPLGVFADNAGDIYVADSDHHRLVKFDPAGKVLLTCGQRGDGPGQMVSPSDVRVAANGTIYIADQDNARVQLFGPDGTFKAQCLLRKLTSSDIRGGSFAMDDEGCLVVCDKSAHVVSRIEVVL